MSHFANINRLLYDKIINLVFLTILVIQIEFTIILHSLLLHAFLSEDNHKFNVSLVDTFKMSVVKVT